jgi:integrase
MITFYFSLAFLEIRVLLAQRAAVCLKLLSRAWAFRPQLRLAQPKPGARSVPRPKFNPHAGIEDYKWHCKRHTFAGRLIVAGVDIRVIGVLLGHRSLSMTMRYSHLAPARNAAAVDRLVSLVLQRGCRSKLEE